MGEKGKEIKCSSCGVKARLQRDKNHWSEWGRDWRIPEGWAVILSDGWLCPKCKGDQPK